MHIHARARVHTHTHTHTHTQTHMHIAKATPSCIRSNKHGANRERDEEYHNSRINFRSD
jgi:hypothetical protein